MLQWGLAMISEYSSWRNQDGNLFPHTGVSSDRPSGRPRPGWTETFIAAGSEIGGARRKEASRPDFLCFANPGSNCIDRRFNSNILVEHGGVLYIVEVEA